MCGICGIVDYRGELPLDEALLRKMAATLEHRGPDDSGTVLITGERAPRVGLGHTRLSVIDLSARGHQPMSDEGGGVWIVYNGEVYNFPSIRRRLEGKGHRFRSSTDTEVVLHAYEEYGEACVEQFNGQFAFAVWDGAGKKLFLARDRVGINPLYYTFSDGRFVFGSEIKAILACPGVQREVDPAGLNDFLSYEFVPSPATLFEGIKKLPPGHRLTLSEGRIRVSPYWDVSYEPADAGEKEFCEGLVEVLRGAVRRRLVSDVPLGAFLSGGLDSSIVVALMSEAAGGDVKTYSIGFEEKSYNELSYARKVAGAFGTVHREFTIRPQAVELFEKLIRYLDDPIADFSIFPTYLVSRMARDYVTVALTGDGGDEIFAGYDTYLADRAAGALGPCGRLLAGGPLARLIAAVPPTAKKKGLVNRAKRFSEGLALPEDLRHFRWMIFLSLKEKEKLYTDDFLAAVNGGGAHSILRGHFARAGDAGELNRQLYVDLKTYLTDNCLVKVDRMSMACSLETRVPLLDHEVIEYMATVPPEMKLKGLTRKYILRRAFSGILPREILTRGKEGFSIPIKSWLRKELKPVMLDLLSEGSVRRRGFFRPGAVNLLITEHLEGRNNHSHRLWALMVFEYWARTFLDG